MPSYIIISTKAARILSFVLKNDGSFGGIHRRQNQAGCFTFGSEAHYFVGSKVNLKVKISVTDRLRTKSIYVNLSIPDLPCSSSFSLSSFAGHSLPLTATY